jgi:hypothetical protein
MNKYSFYYRNDSTKEAVGTIEACCRLNAARLFAERKQLPLKDFLKLFAISK